jgi:hypothetical protein
VEKSNVEPSSEYQQVPTANSNLSTLEWATLKRIKEFKLLKETFEPGTGAGSLDKWIKLVGRAGACVGRYFSEEYGHKGAKGSGRGGSPWLLQAPSMVRLLVVGLSDHNIDAA